MFVICVKEVYFLALGDPENDLFQYFFFLNTMEVMNAIIKLKKEVASLLAMPLGVTMLGTGVLVLLIVTTICLLVSFLIYWLWTQFIVSLQLLNEMFLIMSW